MQMQSGGENNVRTRLAETRLICEREIPIQQQRIDSTVISERNIFDSVKSKAQQTIHLQERLGKLKTELREAEDALVKALSVKTRKEAKQMAMRDSISDTKARIEELKEIVENQRAKKDEYANIISKQSEALAAYEEKCNQITEHEEQIEEAISWYNRVLGFRIECGHGVKFIFSNINPDNANEQYSFVIRHENEIYTLLDCNPPLNDTRELIGELNKSNGLFKFVRTMREKFQEFAAPGTSNQIPSLDQDSSMISPSAPVASVSTDHRSESVVKEKEIQPSESNHISRKVGKGQTILSPGSASSVRRSSRLKVKK
ncbi:kinetochore protein spc25 [Olea europaea var. sylvestris]|uniref:kinetochore protein spc25 n=1 Tax=Olea europaea var. sylvestris TaxID=158386 RepID=UPI000C1CFF95|nr:kinetochore protein spc25 [Olea europaea var. sylvestris]